MWREQNQWAWARHWGYPNLATPRPACMGESAVLLMGSCLLLENRGLLQLPKLWQLPFIGNPWHVLSSKWRWFVGGKASWGSHRTPFSKADSGLQTLTLSPPCLCASTTEQLNQAHPAPTESFASHRNVPSGAFLYKKIKQTPTSGYLKTLKIVGFQLFWLSLLPSLAHISKWGKNPS